MSCNTWLLSRFVHREIVVLTVLVAITVGAFFGTRAVARRSEALRERQAAAWFDTAQRASRDGPGEAVVRGLRRAVSKDPDNRPYRLALADALGATGLDDEARRVLLELREENPDDPETNLQLARLEARGDDTDAARRYYQNALADLWRPGQIADRRTVRFELIEFLLAREERARALSELLLLAANAPQDAALQARIGRMFLTAADPRRALDHFTAALRLDAGHAAARSGAGEAAFALGDYSLAHTYLRAARDDPRAVDLGAVAELVISADPLAPRLQANQRRARLVAAIEQALTRLDACADSLGREGATGLEPIRDEAQLFAAGLPRARQQNARDLAEEGVDLAYRMERAAAERCGEPTSRFDRALLLIGRRHGLDLS
jgi:tetratricopeptide (TPR) repeat protein